MDRLYVKFLVIAALISLACTTKVSEWVLRNSVPENYLLVYYHKSPLTESEISRNNEIQFQLKPANIIFKTVFKNDIEKSHYALYYENSRLSEYENYRELDNIAFSPVREKIFAELMSGKLCVMLFLRSGNREKDERGIQVISSTLATSPFRKVITVVELDRNSVDEQHFVSMLLNVEDDLKFIQEPMLFGIFGRFRALEPLLANGISIENIRLMIEFLTADCSCLIKDNLPGRNILYCGAWENPQPALVNKILDENPELMHR